MMFTNFTCEQCFECDVGLCHECADEFGVCMNCIAYGENNENHLCDNCLGGDEGICMHYDLLEALRWIEFNGRFYIDDLFEFDYDY